MKTEMKKIRESARREISAGRPKEEVFEELYGDHSDFRLFLKIARAVRDVPEPWRIKKYGIWNTLFLLLLAALFIALIISANYHFAALIAVFVYLVAARKTRHYQWISFFGAISLISAAGVILFTEGAVEQEHPLLMYGGIAVLCVIFILFGIIMPKLLTPDFKAIEETKVNSDGKNETRKKLTFG